MMPVDRVWRLFIRPLAVPIGVAIAAGILIIGIGEILLNLSEGERAELERRELWFGVALALAVLGLGALLATRPRSGGLLDREVAVGGRSMFAPPAPPFDFGVRQGPLGTIADLQEGYTLYARSGPLATVLGVLPGMEEFGHRYQGIIYAEGLRGADRELWIPVEAVMAVYPETRAALLAITGDEIDAFGWNRAPDSFRRQPRRAQPPKAL